MNKNGVGINNLQWLICHKTKPTNEVITETLQEKKVLSCFALFLYIYQLHLFLAPEVRDKDLTPLVYQFLFYLFVYFLSLGVIDAC